jgi:hypothetical protein
MSEAVQEKAPAAIQHGAALKCPKCESDEKLYANQRLEVRIPIAVYDGRWDWGDSPWEFLDDTADWSPEHPMWYCGDCDLEFHAPKATPV